MKAKKMKREELMGEIDAAIARLQQARITSDDEERGVLLRDVASAVRRIRLADWLPVAHDDVMMGESGPVLPERRALHAAPSYL